MLLLNCLPANVIPSMLTDQPVLLSLAQLFDALPDGVIYYRAVRDAHDHHIVDFVIDYANPAVPESALHEVTIGTLVRHDNQRDSASTDQTFTRLEAVIETGRAHEFEHYNQTINEWLCTICTKAGDGVLSISRINTTQKQIALEARRQAEENKQQAELYDGVLAASINGIITYEAVRDRSDQSVGTSDILDFRSVTINPVAQQMLSLPDVVPGWLLLDRFPAVRDYGFFDQYVRVVETGESIRFETSYKTDSFGGWYDVAVVKLGDGFVITFNDITVARNGQLALAESAANLQAVIDSSQTGILVLSAVLDPAGAVVDFQYKNANRMVAALVGQTPAMVTGTLLSDWFPSYRDTSTFGHYKHTFGTGENQRFESHYALDGFDVWADIQCVKLGDDVLITVNDYTNLKRAQLIVDQVSADNERQADLLSSVLDSANSGIIAFESIRDRADGPRADGPHSSGTITDFMLVASNEASNRMVGKSANELIGNTLMTLFPGNVETGLFALYVNTVETGEPGRTEIYYNRDELDLWLDISARKLGDGFVVTFTDISVVKRAAKLVEQSAAELQTVIDTSQTGIFLFSPVRSRSDGVETGEVIDFRFRLVNRMLASYVGQEPEAVTGTLGSQWFPDYKTNGLFNAYRKTYLTGETQRFDIHYDGGGIDAWLDIMSTKMGDEVLVTFGDYTPLKKLQQQLESSVMDLQRSNANLEQFAYVASHDLQEPLRKIVSFGNIIETQYGPVIGEQGADMIRRMQSAAARMQVLIKDVLTYSRVATKRDAIGLINLTQVTANVVDDLETAITDQKATVTVDPLPTVEGDAGQLRQLFQNLLSNALKFTKPNQPPGPPAQPAARITVTTRPTKGRDAGIVIPPGDFDRLFHLIEIADNGIGFEPHQADRIFQVFQRLHSRSNYEGTGIGLAIVKKVIENHSGYIEAVGCPGEGATFRILLPA